MLIGFLQICTCLAACLSQKDRFLPSGLSFLFIYSSNFKAQRSVLNWDLVQYKNGQSLIFLLCFQYDDLH